jgi:leucine dehydrogenase
MVTRAGGRVIGAEINPERVERARKRIPSLRIVSPKVIHRQVADIFSPCALGGDLSLKTIPQLKAQIVCGAANNQLASPQDAARLLKRSITYVPDYIANGGGLINVVDELHTGGYSRPRVEKNVAGVYTTVLELLATAGRKHASPSDVADAIAQKRFTKKRIHE